MDPSEEFHAPTIGDLDQRIASSQHNQLATHVPGHMHTASYSFHTRNHSAQLQSPSGTPQLDLDQFFRTTDQQQQQQQQQPPLPQQLPPQLQQPLPLPSQDQSANQNLLHPQAKLAIGTPGPLLHSPGISLGLTPFLGASPFFRQSQPQTAWLGSSEFPKRGPEVVVETESEPKRHRPDPETPSQPGTDQPQAPVGLAIIQEDEREPSQQPAARVVAPVSAPPRSHTEHSGEQQVKQESELDSMLMEVPGQDYLEEMSYKWASDDDMELTGLLENAEKHKWAYISDRLFDKLERRVPPIACQKKFKDLWGDPESSTQLGSSLPYVAYRTGYKALRDLRIVEHIEEYSSE